VRRRCGRREKEKKREGYKYRVKREVGRKRLSEL
jgi:hypothetical protein